MVAEINTYQEDEILINSAINGDEYAFRKLYRKYEAKARGMARRLCGENDLDDLIIQVFMQVWQNLSKINNKKTFASWLYRTTYNTAINQRKSYAIAAKQKDKLAQETLVDNDSNHISEPLYQDIIDEGLSLLKIEHRSVLVLIDIEELSLAEASEVIGIPVGTIKSRLHYARTTMKEFLQKRGVKL